MGHSVRVRGSAGALLLATGLASLVACGGDSGTTVPEQHATVRVDPGDGSVKTSEVAPTVRPGLPEDFPAAEIPLVDEKVLNATKGPDGGPVAWSVVMASGREVSDLSTEIISRFASAGYRVDPPRDSPDISIERFTNASYDVGVTVARTGDGVTITYLVKDRP